MPGNDEKVFEAITATQKFKDYNIESIEKLHGKIETQGMEYVKLLREDNIGFWESEIGREDFSFFLANQYFRTKKMRNGILYTLENARNMNSYFKDIRPENMWIPLSLILASYTGASIISDYSIVLLATVYKGNIIKNLIMDCQSYTKYRPNETTGGIFVSWRRKEELPTGA